MNSCAEANHFKKVKNNKKLKLEKKVDIKETKFSNYLYK